MFSTATATSGSSLAIERASDPGHVIGDFFFTITQAAKETCEIGWTLHPDHTGSGYMTEAAHAVLNIAFNDLRLRRVTAAMRTSPRAATKSPH